MQSFSNICLNKQQSNRTNLTQKPLRDSHQSDHTKNYETDSKYKNQKKINQQNKENLQFEPSHFKFSSKNPTDLFKNLDEKSSDQVMTIFFIKNPKKLAIMPIIHQLDFFV